MNKTLFILSRTHEESSVLLDFLLSFIAEINRIYFVNMILFQAISKMRKITEEGKTFSFSFMSYNSTEDSSQGVVDVQCAKLRKRAKSESYKNADALIAYFDCDRNEARQFYLPCLMFFNGEKISIR